MWRTPTSSPTRPLWAPAASPPRARARLAQRLPQGRQAGSWCSHYFLLFKIYTVVYQQGTFLEENHPAFFVFVLGNIRGRLCITFSFI